jgi:SET domain-containing protein
MRVYPPITETILCKIRPSLIEGVGLFAIKPIAQGTKMFISEQLPVDFIGAEQFDTLTHNQQALILERFPVYQQTGFIHPHSDYLLSFVNHSEQGNYSPVYDVATMDIEEGEEITFDYGDCNPTR